MSLQTKILNLKLEAALAVKHAQGWQRLIDLYGEDKATQFYLHLSLNHLESPETKTCESCEVLKADVAATSAALQEAHSHIQTQDQRIMSQENEIKNRIAAEESAQRELTAYRKELGGYNGLRRIQDLKQQAEDAQAWGDQQHTLCLQEKTRADKAEAELASYKEKKSFEWEGLKLSREPKEHEKIAVKGIANAQESSKEAIGKILLSLREQLIQDGLKGIRKLKPATFHELILEASSESRSDLRDRLIKVYRQGRLLVASELGKKEAVPDDEFDDLDDLTDLTDARIANDVQSRITAAATRFSLLGLTGSELETAIQNEITAGSVTYIDRAATGLANRVINIGRTDEAERRRDEWGRVEYSALLDQNVCGPCASEDGQEADNEADLTPTPNPECEGGDWCRCFHVYINQ